MFKTYSTAKSLAQNLNWNDFEIHCSTNRLSYLDIYLNNRGFKRCESDTKGLGKQIKWKVVANKQGILNLKYDSNKKYQFYVQFANVKTPLKKGSETSVFLEELLNICQTETMHCGYIRPFRGNVFCHYNQDNFSIDQKSTERYQAYQEISKEIEKQRNFKDTFVIEK